MIQLKPFIVTPAAFHELVVMPNFGDIVNENGDVTTPSTEEGDWAVIDSQRSRVPIIDIFGNTNVLKRRDATCKLIYSPAARLGKRWVESTPLYAAVEDCQEEFYQGAFKDYTTQNWEAFGGKAMPILDKGVAADIYTNKYFGDTSRASDPNGIISWNKFDGVFTQYLKYVSQGIVETPFAIPAGALSAAQAYAVLDSMYQSQDELLENMDDELKAFYVDKGLYDSYGMWLISGSNNGFITMAELQAGKSKLYFNGIEVRPKKWNGILKSLNGGTAAHAAILTLRGNFLVKTDSTYGGGMFRNEAVRMWYSEDDNVWRKQIHVELGTEIIAPQHSVLAITPF